jgi:hypothetical protein
MQLLPNTLLFEHVLQQADAAYAVEHGPIVDGPNKASAAARSTALMRRGV